MVLCNLLNKEFKIVVLRRLIELQESTDKHITKINPTSGYMYIQRK